MDILKTITNQLSGNITEAGFEGANIVLYTDNQNFFLSGESAIKEVVNQVKKRIELRADKKILKKEEETEKEIRSIIPSDAEITSIMFDIHRSIVVIEAKRPGMVIGKQGSILEDIKKSTNWVAQVQRAPAIKSKITDSIRSVLYANNNYRRKFLNEIGEKIYEEWNPEKVRDWVRLTFLGSARQVGRSAILLQTPKSKILLDCGIDVSSKDEDRFPVFNIPEFNISELDAIILSHAHLDHSGLLPYMYKMGYKGPVYMTEPTRDIASLLALDFIGVAYKQAVKPLFSSTDVKDMVKHSICLNFNEVTDITPDVRLTFYNAGHVLGSALTHLNIGNGSHNLLYSGDYKYGKTRLLSPAISKFPRVETVITESTYGGKGDVLPPRKTTEEQLIKAIKETVENGGKVLMPELGLGHAQETMLRMEEAMRLGELPKVPIYVDGMVWDINAIHTAYPDYLNVNVKAQIFQEKNPFLSDVFSRVGSPHERKAVIEGGPCIVIATSGMLTGGASVEYLKYFSDSEKNLLILSCYQGPGSPGRQIQEGEKMISFQDTTQRIELKMRFIMMTGLSPHPGRDEIINWFNNMRPKPKRIIVNHGEVSKSLDLASSLYKMHRIETNVPRLLETLRLR